MWACQGSSENFAFSPPMILLEKCLWRETPHSGSWSSSSSFLQITPHYQAETQTKTLRTFSQRGPSPFYSYRCWEVYSKSKERNHSLEEMNMRLDVVSREYRLDQPRPGPCDLELGLTFRPGPACFGPGQWMIIIANSSTNHHPAPG